MTARSAIIAAPMAYALLALACKAAAQDDPAPQVPVPSDIVEVGSEMGGFDGVRQLNIAAGDNNQQANVASIASGDYAINTAIVAQSSENDERDEARVYSARIGADAFAGSNGITSVNIVAGSGNQQANLALVSTGLEGRVVNNAILSQTRASSQPLGAIDPSAATEHTARIDSSAFRNSSGIVQVSLIGGTRNASANVAVLSMEVGTN